MKHAVYLSHLLSNNTPLYGGANDLHIHTNTKIQAGDTANSLMLSFPNHSGTHVDVPYHFFSDGKKLTDYPPAFWIFNKILYIDVPGEDGYLITYEDVKGKIGDDTDLLLLRTGYEKYRNEERYWQRNPGLSVDLAFALRLNHSHIRAVGIDVISITSPPYREEGRKAHREFLGSQHKSDPIVLIEDMSLKNYIDDISRVIVLPLMIENSDGAPCTVLAE